MGLSHASPQIVLIVATCPIVGEHNENRDQLANVA